MLSAICITTLPFMRSQSNQVIIPLALSASLIAFTRRCFSNTPYSLAAPQYHVREIHRTGGRHPEQVKIIVKTKITIV
jgi:hypothetical protein